MSEEKELTYLYCITKSKPVCNDFKDIGVKLALIYFQGICAVISEVSSNEFDEENFKKGLDDMNWLEEKVRRHENVIERIVQETTVLPFKFGTIFNTEENVLQLLKARGTEFRRTIEELNGKEEWGLKIYCDPKRISDTLPVENEDIKKIDDEIASSGKGRAFFLRKKREDIVKNVLDKKISEFTQDSFNRLEKLSQNAKLNKLLPAEITQKQEKMILNAAFLINKKRIKEFDNTIAYLKSRYVPKGLEFDWTGPWPAYNFCDGFIKPGDERS
ncbi:MAG: GvpL/GvpF family gas vesicle protein [Candidatus Omnitrophota bacterium]